MKPPGFWFRAPDDPGWQARLLAPVAGLVARSTARRVARPSWRAEIPVICVGNLTLGGAGKTPTVIALSMRLGTSRGPVHVVSRGYGGSLEGPVRVDPKQHDADMVGDEPLLLEAFAPTWIAKDRAAGVRTAQEAGAGVVILDDGFQNPSVAKDRALVVVDAGVGFGNGRVAPAGPLREPVEAGMRRATACLVIGTPSERDAFRANWGASLTVPVIEAELRPLQTGMQWEGTRLLAFAGIGRPDKFFETLRGLGADLVATRALDDHQALGQGLLRRLGIEAETLNAQLVTTEKDAVRLPAAFRSRVLTLPVRLEVIDGPALDNLIGLK